MRASNFGEREPAATVSRSLRSILVATDLSPRDQHAVQRAWQLADAHRACLRLMYLPQVRDKVLPDAASLLADAARQMEESLELRVRTVPAKSRQLQDLAKESRGTDLVVLAHRRERSAAALFRGQPVLRLLRECACPVLVTRQGRGGPYRRILIAVDFSRESEALVKLAADLDSRAELEIFHAVSTPEEARLRVAEATEQALRAYRERCLRHAQHRMLTLTDSFDARRNRVQAVFGRGDPGSQIVVQQERSDADLVVLCKRRSSAWQDFFCGSVTHRVLSRGSSDVLVVPHGYAPASAPTAARRLKIDRRQPALALHAARSKSS